MLKSNLSSFVYCASIQSYIGQNKQLKDSDKHGLHKVSLLLLFQSLHLFIEAVLKNICAHWHSQMILQGLFTSLKYSMLEIHWTLSEISLSYMLQMSECCNCCQLFTFNLYCGIQKKHTLVTHWSVLNILYQEQLKCCEEHRLNVIHYIFYVT